MTAAKKLVFFVTEDWYFCSHRLPLAIAAREAGYSVSVITRVGTHGEIIESAGLTLVPFNKSRRSKNPLAEARSIWQLMKIYRDIKPDLVHHVAMKPVIYGSIAARVTGVPATVNALAGLGYLFSSDSLVAKILRPFIKGLFRLLLNHQRSSLILQNPDDVELMCRSGTVSRDRVRLIMGSGVDTEEYLARPEAGGIPVVLLASRMLWDKGVGEFVDAARVLRNEGVTARFVLAGDGDDENPGSIGSDQLKAWHERGDIEWWGRCTDMPTIFSQSHLVCLPTYYGEGVPKVLIEAASSGRPIVTTDSPGCREIVHDGVNGILIPARDVVALVAALRELLDSPEIRSQMGNAGRQLVKDRFSIEKVIGETLDIYGDVKR